MSTLTRKLRHDTLHLPRLRYPVRPENLCSRHRHHQNDTDQTGWANKARYGKIWPPVLVCLQGHQVWRPQHMMIQRVRLLFASVMGSV